MEGKLTVYFENPFWVGAFEREDEMGYRVCRVVFGPEPTDAELLAYIQLEYANFDFGEPLKNRVEVVKKKNFKRIQREVRREMGVGTKAQRAMQAALELTKKECEVMSRKRREEEEVLKFKLHQEKKKEKHRGH